MFNSSNLIAREMKYSKPARNKETRRRIKVGRRHTYYYTDSKYYREIYLKSDHWKELRNRKLLANPVCQRCFSKDFLDVHHVRYRNLYDVELYDLQTLCRGCHNKAHERVLRKREKNKQKMIKKEQRKQERRARKNFVEKNYDLLCSLEKEKISKGFG